MVLCIEQLWFEPLLSFGKTAAIADFPIELLLRNPTFCRLRRPMGFQSRAVLSSGGRIVALDKFEAWASPATPHRSYFGIQLCSVKAYNGIPIHGRLFVGMGRSQSLGSMNRMYGFMYLTGCVPSSQTLDSMNVMCGVKPGPCPRSHIDPTSESNFFCLGRPMEFQSRAGWWGWEAPSLWNI
jgi:hypothetical protein